MGSGTEFIDVYDEGASYTVHQLVWHLRGTFMENAYEKVESLLMKREERIRAEMEREVEELKKEREAFRVENFILKDATEECIELRQKVNELEEVGNELKLKVLVEERLRKKVKEELEESERIRARMEKEKEVMLKEMEEVVEMVKRELVLKIEELGRVAESAEAKRREAVVLKRIADERLKECEALRVENLILKDAAGKCNELMQKVMECEKECEALRVENLILKDAAGKCNELMKKVKELEDGNERVVKLQLKVTIEESLRKKAEEYSQKLERIRAEMEKELDVKVKEVDEVKLESTLRIDELRKVVESAEAKRGEVVVLKMIADESLMSCKKEFEALRVENLKLKDALMVWQASESKFMELELKNLKMRKYIDYLCSLVPGAREAGVMVESSHPNESMGEAEIHVRSAVPDAVTAAKNISEGTDLINSVSTANMIERSLGIGVEDRCVGGEKQKTVDVIPRYMLEEPRAKKRLRHRKEVTNLSDNGNNDDPSTLPLGSKIRPCISSIQLAKQNQRPFESECDTPELSSRFKRKSMESSDVVNTDYVLPNRLIQESKKIQQTRASLTPSSRFVDPQFEHYDQAKEIAGNVDSNLEQWNEQLLDKFLSIPDDGCSDSSI